MEKNWRLIAGGTIAFGGAVCLAYYLRSPRSSALRASMRKTIGMAGSEYENDQFSLSRKMFDKYDEDRSGFIDGDEFVELCYDLGHYLSDEERTLALAILDANGNGKIEYAEFMAWWRKGDGRWAKFKLNNEQLEYLQSAATYFQYFDTDRSGEISGDEFVALHANLVQNQFTSKPLEECLQDLDTNSDGNVSYNEYIDWLVRIESIPVKRISQ